MGNIIFIIKLYTGAVAYQSQSAELIIWSKHGARQSSDRSPTRPRLNILVYYGVPHLYEFTICPTA